MKWTYFHHKLNGVYHASIAVSLLPFIYLILEYKTQENKESISHPLLILLLGIIQFFITYKAFKIKKSKQSQFTQKISLLAKLQKYYPILKGFYFRLTVASLVAVLSFYFTNHPLFIFFYLLTLVQFSLNRPHLDAAFRYLALNKTERTQLLKDELLENEKPNNLKI